MSLVLRVVVVKVANILSKVKPPINFPVDVILRPGESRKFSLQCNAHLLRKGVIDVYQEFYGIQYPMYLSFFGVSAYPERVQTAKGLSFPLERIENIRAIEMRD